MREGMERGKGREEDGREGDGKREDGRRGRRSKGEGKEAKRRGRLSGFSPAGKIS